jgi:hypothetical protein
MKLVTGCFCEELSSVYGTVGQQRKFADEATVLPTALVQTPNIKFVS